MANLLHRLLRGRRAEPEPEPEREREPEASSPVAEADPSQAPEPAQSDPSRFEARPTPGRRRRKSSDEISSIGPGEP